MMRLEQVAYFRLPRDEDGRVDRGTDQRAFDLALRWHPDLEDHPPAVSALRRLQGGDEISERHLRAALAYLGAAIDWYVTRTSEPYPGRNYEAAADLRALLDELRVEVPA